jgi:hypothetical protein
MPDSILVHGDLAMFQPAFGPAVVVIRPGTLQASGAATLMGKKVCVDGDEKKVSVPGCAYVAGAFVTPGTGTLKIQALAPNQKALKTKSGKKAVLLKGGSFIAVFQVQSPAMSTSAPPVSDPAPQYPGTGTFMTTNLKFKGT